MTMNRRTFLKGTVAGGAVVAAAALGLLAPTRALAGNWPSSAFGSKNIKDALQNLYGTSDVTVSDAIKIDAPLQAENGAQVPIEVSSTLKGAESLSVFVEKNASPLAANTKLHSAAPFFKARLKMAETADVHVVVKAGGKLYTAKQTIKVTAGGCGG